MSDLIHKEHPYEENDDSKFTLVCPDSISLVRDEADKPKHVLKKLDEAYERYHRESDPPQRRRLQLSIQRALIRSQELGDEKIQIAAQMIDWHSEHLHAAQESPESHTPVSVSSMAVAASIMSPASPMSGRREEVMPSLGVVDKSGGKCSRRQKNGENCDSYGGGGFDHGEDAGLGVSREKRAKTSSKKKKRSKGKSEREVSPPDLPIDPDEPTYCLCDQVSYGEMIGCDNDECPIEWFHFSCVGLHHKPKGKWYCPKCRGDSEKTMDKALERAKKERSYR
ncbi:hypothetical protein CRUP_009968 [Coryphaenoides rupestris]|nr:hypothetical protein CRUP_009968 [Coryphaenoides rupestris]